MHSPAFNFQAADVQAARQELARRSLADFACMVDIPTVPLSDDDEEDTFSVMKLGKLADHHLLLCRKLQQVSDGTIKNLMVLCPPGSAKSTYVDVVFVPWFMALKPRRNVILASYASEIAEKQGRRARQLIKTSSFANLMKSELRQDNKAAHQWTLDNGSEFMAGGLLSGLTGNRAHCFAAGTMVATIDGPKPIEELVSGAFTGYIVSYDTHTRKLVHRRVKAVARRTSQDIYRVHLAHGGVVRCTGDHRFYTARGYVEARFLSQDDRLVRLVQGSADSCGVPDEEGRQERAGGDLLRPCVSADGSEHFAGEDGQELLGVRGEGAREGAGVLLGRMQAGQQGEAMGGVCAFDTAEGMRDVHRDIHAKVEQAHRPLLLAPMQGCGSCASHAGQKQSRLAQWLLPGASERTHRQGVPSCEAADTGAGRQPVCGVREPEQPACAPYRHGCDEQPVAQPGDAVHALPHETAWSRSLSTEEGAVSLVECVCEPTEVFDLQVEGTECFFADGVLVHNCGIIDDPMKGRAEAESETLRDKTWSAYVDDFCSRLIPGAPQIMVLTRWHEDDLAGRILPDGWDGESGIFNGRDGRVWDVLCLPAIADRRDDPLGRQIGETLWPEWFSLEHWEPFKRNKRTWSSLYQQKPAPDDGTFFQKAWFRRYRKGDEPAHMNRYLTSDHAPGGESDSDFSCVRAWGIDAEGDIYLLDGFRSQETMDKTVDKIVGNSTPHTGSKITGMIAKHKPFCWFPEDDNNWKSIAGFVTRRMREEGNYCRIEPITPHGASKPVKAQPFQGMASSGRVWIPEGPEGDDIIEQYLKFPAGKNDDEVDAAALIGRAIDEAHPAVVPVTVAKKFVDRWDRVFNSSEEGEDSWKTA